MDSSPEPVFFNTVQMGVVAQVSTEYVWEMPQSGERVRGLENNHAVSENYPDWDAMAKLLDA